jgi:deazaflavin-dependent oxidoreductase (nitroreductase family)
MERFFYLTTTGRVSGLPRMIEIWFVEYAGRYYLVSELGEESKWLKNIQNDSRVRFRVAPRDGEADVEGEGTARVVSEPELVATVKRLMDAKYRWSGELVVEIAPA